MSASSSLPTRDEEPNADIARWRQGDIVEGGVFVFLTHPEFPITREAQERVASQNLQPGNQVKAVTVATEVTAMVLITQTCDIVRDAEDRPFVEFATVVEISDTGAALSAASYHQPQYVPLPHYNKPNHFADLDQRATLEKGFLRAWTPAWSLHTDEEIRKFADQVARKDNRFAFPNEFSDAMHEFSDGIKKKVGRESSPEGRFLRDWDVELRAEVPKEWSDRPLDVTILVVVPAGVLPDDDFIPVPTKEQLRFQKGTHTPSEFAARLNKALDQATVDHNEVAWCRPLLERAWGATCKTTPGGAVRSIEFEIISDDKLTAARYHRAQRLDLEYLSPAK